MPKESAAAIVLGRKNLLRVVLLAIILSLGGGVYVFSRMLQIPSAENRTAKILNNKPVGQIGQGYFNFEIVDTTSERNQGLSGREKLANTEAMLFVFDQAAKHCFWMKDMKFNIDILWFDANKKLVYEKRNVSPSTYPESFCPDVVSKYVVEVTAGVASKNQITLGQSLDVEL